MWKTRVSRVAAVAALLQQNWSLLAGYVQIHRQYMSIYATTYTHRHWAHLLTRTQTAHTFNIRTLACTIVSSFICKVNKRIGRSDGYYIVELLFFVRFRFALLALLTYLLPLSSHQAGTLYLRLSSFFHSNGIFEREAYYICLLASVYWNTRRMVNWTKMQKEER